MIFYSLLSVSLTKFQPEKLRNSICKIKMILSKKKQKKKHVSAENILLFADLSSCTLIRGADSSRILKEFQKNSKAIWFVFL